MNHQSDFQNLQELHGTELSAVEKANARVVKLSVSEVERFSISLPGIEAQRLRQANRKGSISKKIREAINLQLFLEGEIAAGGEVYVKTGDGELLKLELDS